MTDLEQTREIIDDRLRRVNTALPGRIQSYSASTRKADVEVMLNEKYADGQVIDLGVIANVPVVMPATSSAGVVLPIASGDPVLIVFCQRSIDRFMTQGGKTTPADIRMHSMSDAVAIPGLFDFKVSHSDGDGLRIFNGLMNIRLTSDGKVAIGTSVVELLDEITKALDDIATGLLTIPYTPTITQAASAAIKTIKGSV